MKIEKLDDNWFNIMNVVINQKNGFIKVSSKRFKEFISYLEGEERYEDCQYLYENRSRIIFG